MRALPHVYLSGPISRVEDNGVEWRKRAREEFGHKVAFFDPVQRLNGEADDVVVVPTKDEMYRRKRDSEKDLDDIVTDSRIISLDKSEIRKSEGMIVNHEEVISRGTNMEIMYAWERDKEIALWSDYEVSEMDIWLRSHNDFISDSLEECVEHMEEKFAYNEYANERSNTKESV